jgi:uncharacterized protein YbjQ (UPF0145 family)
MDPADAALLDALFTFGLPIALLLAAYSIGAFLEGRHFRDLRRRETGIEGFPVTTFETLPANWHVTDGQLVEGNVVVSLDYFKRVIAGLRILVGGRVKTYEPLLDRARREAYLRMVEQAIDGGFDAVINVRLVTSRLANARGQGQSTAGVEILAFGTGIRLRGAP